ncbi:PDR/VanB family oxidoreductase [Bradyrhizobium liaoningense]|uniref:PDR/VanB family oxidoreductase n=1 Tax=Bradyrhizobium liaoningense TaxID=43992 RepID=UPI001BAB804C|nr:PDR/VanB family oxidoreductase [Bradyrhizobium liaoningense]MBR0854475.1 oxidoreductase [Bradyrhizobium liaoningense]
MVERAVELRVKRITYEAENINSYELVAPDGAELPPFAAGAHIDLHLANGLIRSYSLLNHQYERHRYQIAVNKDPASRGGSAFIHHEIRAGDMVTASCPRNNFALVEHADRSILIAGGIGITPLLSMVRRLETLGRSWQLFYAARTRRAAAFLDELNTVRPNALHVDFDDERSGQVFDLAGIVARAPANAHLYCCGPAPMLVAFEAAAAARPADLVHVEYFKAKQAPAVGGGFELRLARSNRIISVDPGKSILDALLEAGIAASFSCMEGVCGSCETRVLDGTPDHRDQFLSKEEQATNKAMMICCSGAKSKILTLDL